jgi:preprotein translocase subunit SecG
LVVTVVLNFGLSFAFSQVSNISQNVGIEIENRSVSAQSEENQEVEETPSQTRENNLQTLSLILAGLLIGIFTVVMIVNMFKKTDKRKKKKKKEENLEEVDETSE